jgi:hypothetical protein
MIKSRKMRWAGHAARMGKGEVRTGFRWENVREKGPLEDAGVGMRIILKWIFQEWDGGTDKINLALNRNGWRALVNVIMNFRVPKIRGIF